MAIVFQFGSSCPESEINSDRRAPRHPVASRNGKIPLFHGCPKPPMRVDIVDAGKQVGSLRPTSHDQRRQMRVAR